MKSKIPNPNKMRRISGPKIDKEELRSSKIRITTYLDADVLEALKDAASDSGGKYQTFLNQLLKQSLLSGSKTISERLDKLEQEVFRKKKAA